MTSKDGNQFQIQGLTYDLYQAWMFLNLKGLSYTYTVSGYSNQFSEKYYTMPLIYTVGAKIIVILTYRVINFQKSF